MKKVYFFSAIICILLLTVLAFTSSKKFRAQPSNVSQPTALPQGGAWISCYFYAVNVLSEGQVRSHKAMTEAWYTDFLRANEITRHEVTYVWERLPGSTSVNAVYNLKGFLTPPPTLKQDKSLGTTVNKPDPPSPPA